MISSRILKYPLKVGIEIHNFSECNQNNLQGLFCCYLRVCGVQFKPEHLISAEWRQASGWKSGFSLKFWWIRDWKCSRRVECGMGWIIKVERDFGSDADDGIGRRYSVELRNTEASDDILKNITAPLWLWNVVPNSKLMSALFVNFVISKATRCDQSRKNVRSFDRMTIIYSNFARVSLMMWRHSASCRSTFAID